MVDFAEVRRLQQQSRDYAQAYSVEQGFLSTVQLITGEMDGVYGLDQYTKWGKIVGFYKSPANVRAPLQFWVIPDAEDPFECTRTLSEVEAIEEIREVLAEGDPFE